MEELKELGWHTSIVQQFMKTSSSFITKELLSSKENVQTDSAAAGELENRAISL